MSAEENKSTVNVVAKCPRCGLKLNLPVDLTSLEYKGGIATVSVLHGNPPHSAIVYLDKEGYVRGVEYVDVIISYEGGLVEEERIENLEKYFGREFFTALFSAYIADVPVMVIAKVGVNQLQDFFKALLKGYPLEIPIKLGSKASGFGIYIVRGSGIDDLSADLEPAIVYDLNTGRLHGYETKSNLMNKLVKKWFGKGYKGVVELVGESNKLKVLFSKILDEFEKSEKVSLKKLIKELGLSNREIEYFKDLLKLRGIDVEKRLIWNPFMST